MRDEKKRKRTLAIAIDDHAGGSGTNRPLLHVFLQEKIRYNAFVDPWKQCILADKDATTINGYDITQRTYLIPDKI
jgi:hypothetical protein